MNTNNEKPTASVLVGLMPESDVPKTASKFTAPAPRIAKKIFEALLEGGRETILELIGMVGDQSDYRAGYVLHCLAVQVGQPGRETDRRLFAETLASQLRNNRLSKDLLGFLIRQLQVAGGAETAEAIGEHLLDDGLGEYAAQALIAIGEGAAVQLRNALPRATGKNRLTIVQALGVVRDTESVPLLNEATGDKSCDLRMAAVWALANIGDSRAVDALIQAADGSQGWERIQNTNACLLLAEKLMAAGRESEAIRIYKHLRDTRKDPAERYVREVAEKALT